MVVIWVVDPLSWTFFFYGKNRNFEGVQWLEEAKLGRPFACIAWALPNEHTCHPQALPSTSFPVSASGEKSKILDLFSRFFTFLAVWDKQTTHEMMANLLAFLLPSEFKLCEELYLYVCHSLCFYNGRKWQNFRLTGIHDFLSFLKSNFTKNPYPLIVQLLAIAYPTVLSLFRKSSHCPTSTSEIEASKTSKNGLFPVKLNEEGIFKVFTFS